MTENTPEKHPGVWEVEQTYKALEKARSENTPDMNPCPFCRQEMLSIEELSKTSEWEAKYKTMAAAFRAREAEFNRRGKERQRLDAARKTIEELEKELEENAYIKGK